jgi:protein tyrosine/serine phosphatase
MRPVLTTLTWIFPASKYITRFSNFAQLDGNLTRSGQLTREQLERIIKQYGIKTLISLRPERPEKEWYRTEVATCESANIMYRHLGINGQRSPAKQDLLSIIHAIKTYPKPMHVQCKSGSDRTGLFTGLYEIIHNKKTVQEAKKQVSIYYGNMVPYQRRFFTLLEKNQVNGNLENWIQTEYNPINP